MSPYDLLMPTHAMLARAATNPNGVAALAQGCAPRATLGTSQNNHPNPEGVASPLRKYIIAEHLDTGAHHLVIFAPEIQHRDALPRNTVPLSAGFFIVAAPGKVVIPQVGSDTLNLNPRPEDKHLIEQFLSVPSNS